MLCEKLEARKDLRLHPGTARPKGVRPHLILIAPPPSPHQCRFCGDRNPPLAWPAIHSKDTFCTPRCWLLANWGSRAARLLKAGGAL